jgi:hypothetical protein
MANRKRLDQGSGEIRAVIGQLPGLVGVDDDHFGKGTGKPLSAAENSIAVTNVGPSVDAGLTDATRNHRVDRNPAAHQIDGYARTDLNYFTGKLVSEDQGWDHPGVMPLKRRKVGTTDTDGLRPDHNLAPLGDGIGHGSLHHFPDSDKLGGSHRRTSLKGTDLKELNWTS